MNPRAHEEQALWGELQVVRRADPRCFEHSGLCNIHISVRGAIGVKGGDMKGDARQTKAPTSKFRPGLTHKLVIKRERLPTSSVHVSLSVPPVPSLSEIINESLPIFLDGATSIT